MPTCSFVFIVLVTSVVQGAVCCPLLLFGVFLVLFVAAYLLLMMIACSVLNYCIQFFDFIDCHTFI